MCQTYDLFELSLFYLFILSPPPIAVEAVELMVLRYLFLFSRGTGHFDYFLVFCGFMLCELWWFTEFTQI